MGRGRGRETYLGTPILYIGNVVLLALNLPLIWLWIRLLRVPYPLLFEPAPPVLALVLGPELEAALRRSLIHSRGDFAVFFQRPISAVLLALALALLASAGPRRVLGRRLGEMAGPAPG